MVDAIMNYLSTLVTFNGTGLSGIVLHRPLSWVFSFTVVFIAFSLVDLLIRHTKPKSLSNIGWFCGIAAVCLTLYVAYTGNQVDRMTYDEIIFLVAGMLSYKLLQRRRMLASGNAG